MGCKLIVKPSATIEIENAISDYTAINIALAQKLQSEIRRAFTYIASYPESLQRRYESIRFFWTNKFPFGIYYIFDDNQVFVLAFWHEKEAVDNKVSPILSILTTHSPLSDLHSPNRAFNPTISSSSFWMYFFIISSMFSCIFEI